MGRKRKNTKVSLEGKKRKIEPDVTDKRKLSQDVNKENYVGTFQWAKLQGLKVMCPVLVKSIANDKMLVYVKSDDDIATSDLLERTQISKLLLLQDQDRVGEFKNKCLNDIQLEDVVFDEKVVPDHLSTSGITETDLVESDTGLTSPNLVMEALDEAEAFFPHSDEQSNQKFRKRPSQPVKKMYWSKEEEEEINKLFKSFFDTKTRPKPSHCVKAIQKSKRYSGLIWKRKKDTLKKKVFRMIDKL